MKMNLKTVKDRLKDETLDLSLCELMEVPVREIVTIKKATHLDLSNNLLNSLPNNFVELKRIVKLDLSRNMLTEIPENFGELRQLKHLDLYANQISRLPLSLSELKNLRWLDLKENPLTPAVASVAGPCSNLSECQACARNVVTYLSCVKQSVEEEKLRRLNNATASAESDGATSKKAAKKKKKKQADKSNKDAGDKNETNQGKDTVKTGELKGNALKSPEDKKNKNKLSGYKGGSHSILGSLILWLFFLCLTAVFAVVILPLYFKQVDMFVNYIETNAGIPLKAFRKHSIDMLNAFLQNLVVVYDNLYKAYGEYFNKTIDIPVKN